MLASRNGWDVVLRDSWSAAEERGDLLKDAAGLIEERAVVRAGNRDEPDRSAAGEPFLHAFERDQVRSGRITSRGVFSSASRGRRSTPSREGMNAVQSFDWFSGQPAGEAHIASTFAFSG